MEVQQTSNYKVNRFMKFHFQISATYMSKQKPLVRNLMLRDYKLRILSTLCDFIFMFWPSILFVFAVLGLVSPLNIGDEYLYNTSYLVLIYCVSMLVFNTFSSVYLHGQTLGKRYYRLKVVKKDKTECTLFVYFIRELVGKSLPLAVLFYYFQLYGFIGFCIANALCSIIDRKHRILIDFILRTEVIVLPSKDEMTESSKSDEVEDSITINDDHIKEETEIVTDATEDIESTKITDTEVIADVEINNKVMEEAVEKESIIENSNAEQESIEVEEEKAEIKIDEIEEVEIEAKAQANVDITVEKREEVKIEEIEKESKEKENVIVNDTDKQQEVIEKASKENKKNGNKKKTNTAKTKNRKKQTKTKSKKKA